MSTIPSRSRFAIAAAVLASMTSPIAAWNATEYPPLANEYPLAECSGDCDDAEDCAEGLVCLLRDTGDFTSIPGCSGTAEDTGAGDSIDYCVAPRWDMLDIVGNNGYPASAWPLQECQGDCDSDADCAGHLKCHRRDGQEKITGCIGKGVTGEDYCYNPSLVEAGCIKAKEVPGYKAEGWDYDEKYGDLVHALKAYMHGIIEKSEDEMIPKFIRLGFHDCVGGVCDGCVDLNDPDNKGLREPMEVLSQCQEDFNYEISRSDCWAMATIAASEAAAAKDPNVPADLEYKFTYIGRCDCEDPLAAEIGNGGPHRTLPGPNMHTQEVVDFFYDDFHLAFGSKFTPEQFTVAILGSHAASVANRFNSGFGNIDPTTHMFREDGWVKDAHKYVLSNQYYHSLVDPLWHQQHVDNSEDQKVITDEGEVTNMAAFNVLDRIQWYIDPTMENVIMTGSDIALAVDCKEFLMPDKDGVEGLCLCQFSSEGEIDEELEARIPVGFEKQGNCPSADSTMPSVEKYLERNDLFHYDFAAVIDIMVNNGFVFHE